MEDFDQLQQFLQVHIYTDITKLAFKKTLVKGYDNRFVLNQLYGKQKAKHKFPYLFENKLIRYPAKVSVEQSSSAQTARWKSKLISGGILLDMTGGFGVDAYHFAKKAHQVVYTEQNKDLFDITTHNFAVLKVENITSFNIDSLAFLKDTVQKFDWIYLDPARRDEVGNRKIGLAGYSPNLLNIKDLLLDKTENILLKLSPMLDIQQAISQLETIQKIIVIAVQNEVKELLCLLKKKPILKPEFTCVDLRKNGIEILYQPSIDLNFADLQYSLPKTYLYEPNAAILKAGLFKEIALDFKVEKLHPNTHLYTSDQLISNFPGRIFVCKAVEKFNKKAIRFHLKVKKANITTRNFPYSVAQIKKKLGTKDGGDTYLFATTLTNEKLAILVCQKI